jgi:hypothetical protein
MALWLLFLHHPCALSYTFTLFLIGTIGHRINIYVLSMHRAGNRNQEARKYGTVIRLRSRAVELAYGTDTTWE